MNGSLDRERAALRRHAQGLLARANVVAAGVGYKVSAGRRTDQLSVVCSVSAKRPLGALTQRDVVPAELDGVPTDVVATGPIRALQAPTDRFRPAPGGVSIGHRDITAGTLGCVVRREGVRLILSNNHVLANSNAASPGDPILQPGPADGGRLPEDQIAVLEDFVPIEFRDGPSGCRVARGAAQVANACAALLGSKARLHAVRGRAAENRVDAAVARPLFDRDVSEQILEIGTIKGTGQAELGMSIQKSGRTTGQTLGQVLQIDVSANVQYGAGRVALFTDQLLAGPMSQGGDSGSAVLDGDNRLVGLLFAGSETTTIINRIEHVFSALQLSL